MLRRSLRSLLLATAAGLAGLAGCGDPAVTPPLEEGEEPVLGGPAALVPAAWNEVSPGGDTRCARGQPFSFFVYPGTTKKLVIDFMGGGACFDDASCAPGSTLYTDSVEGLRTAITFGGPRGSGLPGVWNKTRLDSPVREWTHVVVPYCTGDLHWGDKVQPYTHPATGQAYSVHHKGAANARAVLQWVKGHLADPEAVVVMGASAGGYGSIYWTPHVRALYPGVPLSQLSDSAAGVVTPLFNQVAVGRWSAPAGMPAGWPERTNPLLWLPSAQDPKGLTVADLYALVAERTPGVKLSQLNFEQDATQRFFYAATLPPGATPQDQGMAMAAWSAEMRASIEDIKARVPSFRHYLAPGDQHIALVSRTGETERTQSGALKVDFAALTSGGVRFVDFLTDVTAQRTPPAVSCTGCTGGP
jgi:hypothetical protein